MKKLESSLKNMALALTGFSVVAGGLLGWVNDVTAEPIAQANAKTLSDAHSKNKHAMTEVSVTITAPRPNM